MLERMQEEQRAFYEEQKGKNVKEEDMKAAFAKTVVAIDKLYKFTQSKNSEIRFRWFVICIRAEYEPAFASVVAFLKEQGRMKFIRPLYRELFASVKGKDLALSTFRANANRYHSIAAKMVGKDLQLSE